MGTYPLRSLLAVTINAMDGSLAVLRESMPGAEATPAAQQKYYALNAAIMTAIEDLKNRKGDSRIVAEATSDFFYAATGASSPSSLKSTFDNTEPGPGVPLLPFAATAQVSIAL